MNNQSDTLPARSAAFPTMTTDITAQIARLRGLLDRIEAAAPTLNDEDREDIARSVGLAWSELDDYTCLVLED
jgi:hypothetical protein